MLNRCTHLISLSSPKPRRIMDVDMWLSLPPDLFLEIFCRLEAAAALRCTRVCKPWQHTILGSAASYLRPRPYFFVPGLEPRASSSTSSSSAPSSLPPFFPRHRQLQRQQDAYCYLSGSGSFFTTNLKIGLTRGGKNDHVW